VICSVHCVQPVPVIEVAVELVLLKTETNATKISRSWILAGAVMTTDVVVDLLLAELTNDTAILIGIDPQVTRHG